MKIIIRVRVEEDLDRIFAWIAKDSPRAAANMIRRIPRSNRRLAVSSPAEMGRPGREPGTRELVEAPYIIVYEVHRDRGETHVLAIFHGAQNR
jgi:toxin ParE1/3/4